MSKQTAKTKNAFVANKLTSIESGGHRAKILARRDALIAEYLDMVEPIARAVAQGLPPSFELDDLIQTGRVALLHAATRYRPGAHGGAPFHAYAKIVIRGAIIESARRKRYTAETMEGLQAIGEPGADSGPRTAAGDGVALPPTLPDVEHAIDRRRLSAKIREVLSWLPDDQRRVVLAYYAADEPTLAEVADRLFMSRRRTQFLHARALATLEPALSGRAWRKAG